MATIAVSWLGRIAYGPALSLQQRLAERRARGDIDDTLLLLEHDAVFTLGRRAAEDEILLDAGELAARGIAVEHTDRGGRVTYHGPGQLVGYPIIDLGPTTDLVGYVRTLEHALIATAADLGITAGTIEGLTGVWVGDAKLAAIGVHVSRGITTHGFAINVTTDLSAFGGIIPCGITDKAVTSIEGLTGGRPALEDVGDLVAGHLARALGRTPRQVDAAALGMEPADA
jgi:lipoyl(octanoyl) transferase